MIEPAPTTKVLPPLVQGVVVGVEAAASDRPAMVRLSFPDTNYDLHLVLAGELRVPVGKRVMGTIRARARRVDVVGTGGRYVEPVAGRPRRVQGTVVAADERAGTITVHAGVAMVCALTDARQSPGQFERGMLVSFDVEPGATFAPSA